MKVSFGLWKHRVIITKEEKKIKKKIEIIGEKDFNAIYYSKKRKFSIPALEEGIRQAELRLKDANDIRNILEKRAYNLLYFFTSLIIAFTSLITVLISLKISGSSNFLIGGAFIAVSVSSIILIVIVSRLFKLSNRGSLGRLPDTWLVKGVIEGNDNSRGQVLAKVLYDYQERIEASEESNKERTQLIDRARKILVFAPLLFSILSAIVFFCN